MPEGRLFAMDMQTLISALIQLFNVLLLAGLLGFILYKPVRKFLRNREEYIGGKLSDARTRVSEADELKAQYEAKLAGVEAEKERILEAARTEAMKNSASIIDAAKEEAAQIKRRADEIIKAEKERLKDDTKLYIIELSSLMAGKLIKKDVDDQMQDELFDESIAELEEATWPS